MKARRLLGATVVLLALGAQSAAAAPQRPVGLRQLTAQWKPGPEVPLATRTIGLSAPTGRPAAGVPARKRLTAPTLFPVSLTRIIENVTDPVGQAFDTATSVVGAAAGTAKECAGNLLESVTSLSPTGVTGAAGGCVTSAAAGAAVAGAKAAAGAIGDGIFDSIAGEAAKGTVWLIGQVGTAIDKTADPQVRSTWFRAEYARMARVALLVTTILVLLGLITSALRGDGREALAMVFGRLPASAMAAAVTLAFLTLGLSITDELCRWFVAQTGTPAGSLLGQCAKALEQMQAADVPGVVRLLICFVGLIAALILWMEMLLRANAIYVVAFFMPLAYAGLLRRSTQVIARRSAYLLGFLVASKFVITAVLCLGFAAGTDGLKESGVSAGLTAVVLLGMATLSPFSLFWLFNFTEEVASASAMRGRGPIGGARNAVASAASPVSLMRSGFRSTATTSSAGGIAGGLASGGGPADGGAVGGDLGGGPGAGGPGGSGPGGDTGPGSGSRGSSGGALRSRPGVGVPGVAGAAAATVGAGAAVGAAAVGRATPGTARAAAGSASKPSGADADTAGGAATPCGAAGRASDAAAAVNGPAAARASAAAPASAKEDVRPARSAGPLDDPGLPLAEAGASTTAVPGDAGAGGRAAHAGASAGSTVPASVTPAVFGEQAPAQGAPSVGTPTVGSEGTTPAAAPPSVVETGPGGTPAATTPLRADTQGTGGAAPTSPVAAPVVIAGAEQGGASQPVLEDLVDSYRPQGQGREER